MIVVKMGGGGGVDLTACCADLADLRARGERVVLVHGGSGAATALGEALGHAPAFIRTPSGVSSRYTDRRTLEIFTMALAGINKDLVARLQALGVNALGLSGLDGGVLIGRRKEAVVALDDDGRRRVIRDDRSGAVESVNVPLLDALLGAGYLPVLSPPALSADGPINVDADRAAAQVALALGASTLILLTNVPGVLRDRHDDASLIGRIAGPADLDDAMSAAAGRMRVKLIAAREAVQGGVARVVIGDGRVEQPIARALDGVGTMVSLSDVVAIAARGERS